MLMQMSMMIAAPSGAAEAVKREQSTSQCGDDAIGGFAGEPCFEVGGQLAAFGHGGFVTDGRFGGREISDSVVDGGVDCGVRVGDRGGRSQSGRGSYARACGGGPRGPVWGAQLAVLHLCRSQACGVPSMRGLLKRRETCVVSFYEFVKQRALASANLAGPRRRNRRVLSTQPMVLADTDAQELEDEIRRHEQQGTDLPTVPRSDLEACFPDKPAD